MSNGNNSSDVKKLAEEIANALFVNGAGQRAEKLILELPDRTDGGCWCKNSVISVIENISQIN